MLRAIVRVVILSLWILLPLVIYLLGLVLLLPMTKKWTLKWRFNMIRLWGKVAPKILGINIYVKGVPPVPPFFLVSNHLSYIDLVVYFNLLSVVFVAKSEVSTWPVFGFIARLVNTIFINRTLKRDIPRVNALIARHITPYNGIIIFPEATSTKGDQVMKFKPALFEFPAFKHMPVHCATLHYETSEQQPPASQSVCWWGDMTFVDHFFNMMKIPHITATVTFNPHPVIDSNRKILAENSWQNVQKAFIALE